MNKSKSDAKPDKDCEKTKLCWYLISEKLDIH